MTLRTRLIISHSLAALVAIVLVSIVTSVAINRYFRTLAQTQARREVQPLLEQLEYCYEYYGGWPAAPRLCVIYDDRGGGRPQQPLINRRLMLADENGIIIFDTSRYASSTVGKPVPPEAKDWTVPIKVDGAVVGSIVARPNEGVLGEAEDHFVKLVRQSMIIASVGGGVLALLAGLFLATRLTKPLHALTSAAYRLAQGDRSARVPHSRSPDEVGELSRAFNTMSAALEQGESTRRQMVADIAHELRTPLSVLQLELESIEDGVVQPTPAVIASLSEEVGLLNRLISDLRTLSLADAGQLQLHLQPLDVGAFMQRLLPRYQTAARDKEIELRASISEDLGFVLADEDRLAQVLHNLIHNALRYTPVGGAVLVTVKRVDNEIQWMIKDSGPGFPAEEAESIFERFYRTDKARARESGGTGLGLPIARGITQAMGGRVWARSEQGAIFFVALPLATSAAIMERLGN